LRDELLPRFDYAEAACARKGVLLALLFPYGISPYFVAYPGASSGQLSTERCRTTARAWGAARDLRAGAFLLATP